MSLWNLHLRWLGHSQNSIELSWLELKKPCNSLRIAAVWDWNRWGLLLNIFFAVWMESVMTMTLDTFSLIQAWLISHLMANSSTSVLVTNAAWLSGAVHTGVEVCRMDLEMSGLVEWPWLQLMCCTVCLPCGRNFRWRRGSPSGSECWMVCCRWTPEIEFNKRLSSSIIRLANYSVTTSLIYKLII